MKNNNNKKTKKMAMNKYFPHTSLKPEAVASDRLTQRKRNQLMHKTNILPLLLKVKLLL